MKFVFNHLYIFGSALIFLLVMVELILDSDACNESKIKSENKDDTSKR